MALLLPDWSSWELPPPPELSQEQQAAAAAALTATAAATAAATSAPAGQNAGSTGGMGTGDAGSEEWTLLRSAPLGPPPGLPKDAVAVEVGQEEVVGPSSHASPSTASAAEPSRRSPSPSPQTTISQPSSVPPEGRGPASSSSGRSSTPGSSGSSAASPPPGRLPSPPLDGKLKLVEAKAWGTAPAAPAAKQQPAFFPSMQTFRDAAHLAQGHYVANNPSELAGLDCSVHGPGVRPNRLRVMYESCVPCEASASVHMHEVGTLGSSTGTGVSAATLSGHRARAPSPQFSSTPSMLLHHACSTPHHTMHSITHACSHSPTLQLPTCNPCQKLASRYCTAWHQS